MSVKLLGFDADSVDIRLVLHSSNPFCKGLVRIWHGAIDGAITIKIRMDGYWEIRSGNHREMPNHYIYIYNGGRVTDVYKDVYKGSLCLIGSAFCPLVDLSGYYGRFR